MTDPATTTPQSPSEGSYALESIDHCWFGGEGYLSGIPVVRVILRGKVIEGTTPVKLHDLIQRIAKGLPTQRTSQPLFVFLDGDAEALEEQLIITIRGTLGLSVYSQTTGERPLIDRNGRTPLPDHLCLRLRSPYQLIARGVLFHSVVVQAPCDPQQLVKLSERFDRDGTRVYRYIATSDTTYASREDLTLAAVVSRAWRLTRPIIDSPNASVVHKAPPIAPGGSRPRRTKKTDNSPAHSPGHSPARSRLRPIA